MRLPSFRVRTLMIAVAIEGLMAAAVRQYRHGERMRPEYRDCAWYYALQAGVAQQQGSVPHRLWAEQAREAERRWRNAGPDPLVEKLAWMEARLPRERHADWLAEFRAADARRRAGPAPRLMSSAAPEVERRRADHFARLAEKYRFAARYPWLPAEPDPPEPQ